MNSFGMGQQNPMMFGGVTSLAPLGAGMTGMTGFPSMMGQPGMGGMSMADMRCCQGAMNPAMMGGAGIMNQTEMLGQILQLEQQVMMTMLQMLLSLLMGQARGGGLGSGGLGALGGGGNGYGAGGGGGTGGAGGAGAASGGGATGGGATVDSGPVNPGVGGLLEHANRMVGLDENRDTKAIEQVTEKSGINPAKTPWCAAWAMNMLEMHGVMKLDGLSNRNYCPTIESWSKSKGTWQTKGNYQPKAGDAILFDWQGDGTPDHIGIVEKVVNGKVYTIEGNSSDKVSKNSYALGSGNIAGYVKS